MSHEVIPVSELSASKSNKRLWFCLFGVTPQGNKKHTSAAFEASCDLATRRGNLTAFLGLVTVGGTLHNAHHPVLVIL